MKELKEEELNSDFSGVVEGFTPGCSSCRAALFKLGSLEKKYEIGFYKINLSENPKAAELMSAEKLPSICLFEKGKPVFSGCGIGSIKELEEVLEGVKK